MKENVVNIDHLVRILAGAGLTWITLAGLIGSWGWVDIVAFGNRHIPHLPDLSFFQYQLLPHQ